MTQKPLFAAMAASAAALALCAPLTAGATLLLGADASPSTAPQNHLAHAMAGVSREEAQAAPSMFAQAAIVPRPRVQQIERGPSDVALWNLVATIHAQQKSRSFDVVDMGAKTVWEIEKQQVSAVPLPGAIWLFVMGVLGLAGTSLTRRAAPAKRESEQQPLALPWAAAA